MASINKVIIIGNLGADPECRTTPRGDSVANVNIATSESWKDANGNKQEKTEWHRVTFFGKLADIVGQYLNKGSQVYVEGKLQTSKYTGNDGIERYQTSIIASSMQMLGGKSDGQQKPQPQQKPSGRNSYADAKAGYTMNPDESMNDPIPF